MVDIKVHPYADQSDDWKGFTEVLTQGCKAVRECCPDAKIIIHTERAVNSAQTEYFYQKLSSLDYDIIGLSYYPFWHSDLTVLSGTLEMLAASFPGKQVQIVETGYNYRYWPDDAKYNTKTIWPNTTTGQQQFVKDLVTELQKHEQVNGLYYWFPEENGNGGPSYNKNTIVIDSWENRGLWDNTSHKALPALYELKAYRTDLSSLNSITLQPAANDAVYDILGQRVNKMTRGNIYIRNGRKYFAR